MISTKDQKNFIKLFLLTNGLPFFLIDDRYLKNFLVGKISRKALAVDSSNLAESIRQNIKKQLIDSDSINIVIDEWSDDSSRPFLGVQCHTRFNNRYIIFQLDHIYFQYVHNTTEHKSHTLNSVFDYYLIGEKVKYVASDRANLIISVIKKIGLKWSLCYCHLFNSVLTQL